MSEDLMAGRGWRATDGGARACACIGGPNCCLNRIPIPAPVLEPIPDAPVIPLRLSPINPAPSGVGWLCPACGRGNAPGTSTCPCIPIPMTVTC